MTARQCDGTGSDDAAPGRMTTSARRLRWCLVLAAAAASTFLFSLSASQASAQLQSGTIRCPDDFAEYDTVRQACIKKAGTEVLRGAFPPTTSVLTSSCYDGSGTDFQAPGPPTFVVGVTRFADPVNTYTRGVQPICSGSTSRGYIPPPVIGSTSTISAASRCAPLDFPLAIGIYGRVGDVVDGLGVTCAPGFGATAPYNSPYVGGFGGLGKGPFACPTGTYMYGLQAKAASYGGGYNIVSVRGLCKANTTTGGVVILGDAAPAGSTRTYRASASQGPVKFTIVISKALDKPSSWHYAIQRLVVATSCSRAARVPGAIVVSDRRRVSQQRKFSARRGDFRIAGRVYGPLARPKVRAKVTVLKGACRGEVLTFNAVKSR